MKIKDFPPPLEKQNIESTWIELVVGTTIEIANNPAYHIPLIVDKLWSNIFNKIQKEKNVIITGPMEEPWFHLRRRWHQKNPELDARNYALGRIELLRLKKGIIEDNIIEEIRLIALEINDIPCAGWWPIEFKNKHDTAFLSFLQQLSVLRGRDKIFHNKYLAQITDRYDLCPYCQEAYQVMTTPNSPWTDSLKPWFNYMSSTNMEKVKTHEYAHWFGHILSGWPDIENNE